VILLVSGPSMLIAYLKLRKRNLGPILDANGWAVNAKAKINVPFGGSLTAVASLPPGSKTDFIDPFAEKQRPWKLYIVLATIVLLGLGWLFGKFDRVLPDKLTSTYVIKGRLPEGSTPTAVPVVPVQPAPTTPAEAPK
jgi:hypothetical protein